MSTSSSRIATVNGTFIVIITVYLLIFTSGFRITRIYRTSVIIIAVYICNLTSGRIVASLILPTPRHAAYN
jgi:hypothetical protein